MLLAHDEGELVGRSRSAKGRGAPFSRPAASKSEVMAVYNMAQNAAGSPP